MSSKNNTPYELQQSDWKWESNPDPAHFSDPICDEEILLYEESAPTDAEFDLENFDLDSIDPELFSSQTFMDDGFGDDGSEANIFRLTFGGWQRILLTAALSAGFLVAAGLWRLTAQSSFPLSLIQSPAGIQTGEQNLQLAASSQEFGGSSSSLPATTQTDQASDECSLSERFPPGILRWCESITQYARKRDLPPDLIAALILQESGGNPSAFSASGAVGLMQVMPSDGPAASFMCVNGPCFANRPSAQELEDPDYNIAYGTRMLASLLGRHGDLREALRSYGPEDVGYTYADKVLGIYQRLGN